MITEEYLKDGKLVRHVSDSGFLLRQIETGVKYASAVDVVPCVYTYEETDEPIPERREMKQRVPGIRR